MKRASLILLSVRLANSLSSTQQLGLQRLTLNQVTHSYNTHSSNFSLIKKPQSFYISPNLHQNFYYSSQQESFVQLILSSNNWSEEIENELENMNPKINHESVVYVLKNLDRNPQKSFGFFTWVRDKISFELNYIPYSILLKTLACKDFTEEFWDVAMEMEEKGINIDAQLNGAIVRALEVEELDVTLSKWHEFYKTLKVVDDGIDEVVKGVTEIILRAEWSKKVMNKLMKLSFPLSDDILIRVIFKLKDEPLKAFEFFKWVSSHLKYEHNGITYSGMARVLARRGLICEFWDLLMQMRKKGCEIDNDSYVKITNRVDNVEAVKLFEFMMDGPYKLSEQECSFLLKTLAHENEPDMDLVTRVLNKYLEMGNSYTKGIYTIIHRILCKLGRFDEAMKIVEDMKKAGHEPDNIIYSQEIYGLCKCNRFEDARLVFNQMEIEGCIPDIKTWTILIRQYCLAGQVDQALSCFEEMLGKNISPDADLLEVLINGFLAHNKLLDAYKFLVEMVNKSHLKPWQATYKHMIEMLLKDRKLEEAFNVLCMMEKQNYPAYSDPFVPYN